MSSFLEYIDLLFNSKPIPLQKLESHTLSMSSIQQSLQNMEKDLGNPSYFSKTRAQKQKKDNTKINSMNSVYQVLLKSQKNTNSLKFYQSLNTVNETNPNNRTITYYFENNKTIRITNQSNLSLKMTKLYSRILPTQNNTQNQELIQQTKYQAYNQNKKKFRYFNDAQANFNLEICHRCRQFGHYAKICTKSIKDVCLYCMGNHHFSKCGQFVCYLCNQNGHRKNDCVQKGQRCLKCKKYGHEQKDCGTLIFAQNLDDFGCSQLGQIVCLKCDEIGHFNCCKNNIRDDLYQIYNNDKNLVKIVFGSSFESENCKEQESQKMGQKRLK